MSRRRDPNASVAWLPPPASTSGLAGAAFLIGPELAVTCAHAVREHLGLGTTTPVDPPQAALTLHFAALDREVSAHVAHCGWFPEAQAPDDRPSDIAILRLEQPINVPAAGPAINPPANEIRCYAFGCPGSEAGKYKDYGQHAYLKFRPILNARGLHQLYPDDDVQIGYVVTSGFSGAPVFDALGNTVLAMIVRADEDKHVAFAVPAEKLQDAIDEVRACAQTEGETPPEVILREPGPVDQDAIETMVRASAIVIAEAAGVEEQPPITDLRNALRSLADIGRTPDQTETVRRALEAIRQRDTKEAENILVHGPTVSEEAYRQASALVFLRSPQEAFRSYRIADALANVSRFDDQLQKVALAARAQLGLVKKQFDIFNIPVSSPMDVVSRLFSEQIRRNIQDHIQASAYFIWENAGRPMGFAIRFWLDAERTVWGPLYPLRSIVKELAEELWEQAGRRQDRELDFWLAAEEAVLRELEANIHGLRQEETESRSESDNLVGGSP